MVIPSALGAVRESMDPFPSGGLSITVERFEPPGAGPFPAIVFLHGTDALSYMGEAYRGMARAFAGRGYAVFLVHYFGGQRTRWRGQISPLEFAGWMQVVSEAISFAAGQREVDAGRIALLGFSLGAYLALAVASQEPRVAAVVECGGGLPDVLAEHVVRLPPTLIIHGEEDWAVPVEEARKLERLLKEKELPHAVRIYPGEGHNLLGSASRDAFERAVQFLDHNLGDGHVRTARSIP